MIGKPIALIQVPNQRLFGPRAAARYLGVHTQTLKKLTDLGTLNARWMGNRKVYLLDDLQRYIDRLPVYNPSCGKNPREEGGENGRQSMDG